MTAELGIFFLILGLLSSLMLILIPGLGLQLKKSNWIESASYYAVAHFISIVLAYSCLSICFLRDDFSVQYVLNNSSLALPWFYKLCAVWGGHEGSMLLWLAILSFWMILVSLFSQSLDQWMKARVLVILGALSLGFILFLLSTSNPFLRQFGILNSSGRDLNPLLQDPGFLFHPPMLYMGYVGFSVAFAFAIAALWAGEVERSFSKWARPWTLAAWSCLTIGITLGSWWAYRELGWGGWWFWDPVENASFMPWLVGTALIHSLAVVEQRNQFKAWTLLLAITAFSLSLIGTFLVRSGVLTSVHAFAVDPQRGFYILAFLGLVIGGSLLLFLFRAQSLQKVDSPSRVSRESALLLNNIFLVVLMLSVLMGTVYPLLVDGLGLGKLSVGAPYFNAVFVPLMVPFALLMGLGPHVRWQKEDWKNLFKTLKGAALFSIVLPCLVLYALTKTLHYQALLGLILAGWIILSSVRLLQKRIRDRGLSAVGQGYWGMLLAHCGLAVTLIGIAVSTAFGIQKDVLMSLSKSIELGGYQIRFISQSPLKGPNYTGIRTKFLIRHQDKQHFIYPEKRLYTAGGIMMTEAAIDAGPFKDLYVALGEPINKDSWSIRVYFKPLVRWIWGGGFMILAGGLLCLTDRRYYQKKVAMPLNGSIT